MQATDITKIPAITETWKVVRDGVNIVFIAVLLVFGVFNIIHYEPDTYTITNYMPNFVIAVIGVNFSKLMCMFILDFVNVLTASIYTYLGGAGDATGVTSLGMYGQNTGTVIKNMLQWNMYTSAGSVQGDSLEGTMNTIKTTSSEIGKQLDSSTLVMVKMILGIVILVFLIYGFLGLTGLFLVRVINLWVLIASSPLFFMGLSSEFLSNISSGWWESFWKYASMPIKVSAYLSIGLLLATKISYGVDGIMSGDEGALVSNAVNFDLPRYILLCAAVVGTIFSAFNAAKDDGAGDKISEWMKDKAKLVPGTMGTLGYALGEKIQSTPSLGKVGKIVGKATKHLTSPLRIGSTITGIKEIVGEELKRNKTLEQSRGVNALLKNTGLKRFDWASNAIKRGYEDQVDAANKVYKGKTSSELISSLKKSTDKAEMQGIIKELAEGQGVSIRTLFENNDYAQFRRNIDFKYDDTKSDKDNYHDFTSKLDVTFPYQFWNTITPSAHKKRKEEADQADFDTKEMEEMNMQTDENIWKRVLMHAENGNGYRAVALAVRNVQDSNLSSEDALKMVKRLYDDGKIGIDELNTFGRIGQQDGKGAAAMTRRFTEKQFNDMEQEFGITKDSAGQEKFAELMTKIVKNEAMTASNGKSYLAASGATIMFEENLNLDPADLAKYNSLSVAERGDMINALRAGEAYRSADGSVIIDKNDAERYQNETENKIESLGNDKLYDILKSMYSANVWFKSNEFRDDLQKKGAYDVTNERVAQARNINANAIKESYKQNTDGSLMRDPKIYYATLVEGGMIDIMNSLDEIRKGMSKDLLMSEKGSRESLQTRVDMISSRATSFNQGSIQVKEKMNQDDKMALAGAKDQYDRLNSNLGLNLSSWNTITAGINDPTLQIAKAYQTVFSKMKEYEDTNIVGDENKVTASHYLNIK